MPEFDLDAALTPEPEPVMPPVNLAPLHESELGRLLYERRGRTLFYPACCVDWQPLIRLSHLCDTFLYCDLGMSLECFTSSLPGNLNPHPNLRLVDLKPIDSDLFDDAETGLKQLFPDQGFAPRYAPQVMGGQKAILELRMGDCVRTITLIYLNQEGIAAYYGLYSSRGVSPRVICRTDNGFMHQALWAEPFGRLVDDAHEKPEFLLDGIGGYRRNDWPWPHVWQVYPRLIPGRLEGCCYSKEDQKALPERTELNQPTRIGGRSVSLRQEPLRPENIENAEVVLITHIMSQNVVWPPDKEVIVLQRRHYVRSRHPRENVLFNQSNEIPTMRSTLDELTCFCRAHGIKRVASVPIGFEHEGCELADWQAETGSELHITFYCETPGDYFSLSNHV